jgi:hypothetical protein
MPARPVDERKFPPPAFALSLVIAEALSEDRIREWFFADAVTRRILQALLSRSMT